MVALAQALLRRGHQAVIAAPANFEAWVTSHRLPFVPLGTDMQEWMGRNERYLSSNPLKLRQGMANYFNEQLPVQFTALAAAAQGSDALVSAGIAFSAQSVAALLGIPHAVLAYSTAVLPARGHPPPTAPWYGLPGWVNALLWRLHNGVGDGIILPALNAGRARLGLAPVASSSEHLFGSTPFVLVVDEGVLPPSQEWQGRYPYANFLFYDDPRALDPELDTWLREGEPPLFVGFGSMAGDAARKVGGMLTHALEPLGRRCLIGAGWGGLGGEALPKGWRVVQDAPHALLFPRTAAVVHHGGSGTTASALRAGVPQVILPLIFDQFHHARRLHEAGLAAKPTPMARITPSRLTSAVQEALALPEGPRRQVAERLRASDGAGQVVSLLEERVRAAQAISSVPQPTPPLASSVAPSGA